MLKLAKWGNALVLRGGTPPPSRMGASVPAAWVPPLPASTNPRLVIAADNFATLRKGKTLLTASHLAGLVEESVDVALAVCAKVRSEPFDKPELWTTPFGADPRQLVEMVKSKRAEHPPGGSCVLELLRWAAQWPELKAVVYIGDTFTDLPLAFPLLASRPEPPLAPGAPFRKAMREAFREVRGLLVGELRDVTARLRRNGTRVFILFDTHPLDNGIHAGFWKRRQREKLHLEYYLKIAKRTRGSVIRFNETSLHRIPETLQTVAAIIARKRATP
jgi:hypothetical protein